MTVDQLINRLSILTPEERKYETILYLHNIDLFMPIKDIKVDNKDKEVEITY